MPGFTLAIFTASLPRRRSSHIQEVSVRGPAATRFLLSVLLLVAAGPPFLMAEDGGVEPSPVAGSYIFVGFVGGFVHHDNPHHGPVMLAQRMHKDFPSGAYVRVFENRHRRTAYHTILHLLDSNHDGRLSSEEKNHARIVLFGQSWGGSEVVSLARELDRAGIPVLLTVQVDSVAKPFERDDVIPDNVAAAVNFYQPHGILHGRPLIRAEDGARTQILGNYLFDYKGTAVKCEGMPWFERAFIPGHMHTECDLNLWERVETVVRQQLDSEPGDVAAIQHP
jgi:hypothetical protein